MKYMNFKLTLLIGLMTVILTFFGCFSIKPIYHKEEKKLAENETKIFHQLYNEQKFEEIYELTDQRARVTKEKKDLLNLMNVVFTNHGRISSSEIIKAEVVPHASFSEVQLLYKTKFEKGEAYENFTWYVENGKAGLFSYSTGSSENE